MECQERTENHLDRNSGHVGGVHNENANDSTRNEQKAVEKVEGLQKNKILNKVNMLWKKITHDQ